MEVIDHGDYRIVHLHFKTQYELTSSFVRIQEFYESPFENIRGDFFTLDEFMDTYAAANKGVFSYFEDWAGFNVPGNVVADFYEIYRAHLRPKEQRIMGEVIGKLQAYKDDFYIIGTYEMGKKVGKYVDHEIAHALYYLSPDYKSLQDEVVEEMDPVARAKAAVKLVEMGYMEGVINDEIQAYFSTDDHDVLMQRFGLTEAEAQSCHRFRFNFNSVKPTHKEKALA